ncbi:MAG TPA: DUF456 domain-containing protein [Natrialbaceae archaeon]|nr:DUF456 domain-containing protein [Natrialbaceae archaeon]
MVDPVVLVAVALAVLGVVGSVTPLVPGAGLSLVGIFLYWWHTGYTDPGTVVLVALTILGLATMAVDYLAGLLSAKASGASWTTGVAAGIVGLVLLFVAGPVGVVGGVAGTVFAIEYYRNGDREESFRMAVRTTVAMLGSTVVQVLFTATMLVAFLIVVWA